MFDGYKTALSELLHLSKDALHIHIGIALFVVAALVFRRSFASWLPWFVLLGFELLNEAFDSLHSSRGFGLNLAGSLKDIANTMLWPTVIVLALRLRKPPADDRGAAADQKGGTDPLGRTSARR